MTRALHQHPRALVGLDHALYLSELARQTRRPGQTLQARLNELRRECGG
jgi:hypothetical protein